jgi:hypothetical protein
VGVGVETLSRIEKEVNLEALRKTKMCQRWKWISRHPLLQPYWYFGNIKNMKAK